MARTISSLIGIKPANLVYLEFGSGHLHGGLYLFVAWTLDVTVTELQNSVKPELSYLVQIDFS